MNDTLVDIADLTKRFDGAEKCAIDALTTSIRAGRVTGLVGPDGAGKTTLMRLMAALLMPTSGRLTVCGRDAAKDAPGVHAAIGYMPQRFGLYEDLSVLENLTLYAELRGVTGEARRETFERLLAFTDLARFTARLAGDLPEPGHRATSKHQSRPRRLVKGRQGQGSGNHARAMRLTTRCSCSSFSCTGLPNWSGRQDRRHPRTISLPPAWKTRGPSERPQPGIADPLVAQPALPGARF